MAVAQPPRALLRLLGFACLVSGKDPPCPEDATVMSCSDWCRTVYPGSRATMSGSSCARLSAQDMKRGMGPACICYDSGYEKELKSCRSKCPVEEDPAEASGDDGEVGCFGSTGRDTCRADQLTDESERYLLYDVKPGEGFNLQREVFPRVGWIVAQLNAARCSGDRCPRWSLVLPPWCRLAHWRRASEEHVAWEKFFDAKALRSTNVTVLEFHEFVARAGGPKVDLVISSTTERQSRNQMMSKPRKSGGFYGFTRTPQQCFSGGRGGLKPPRQEWMAEELRWRVTYSGNCAEGVAAIDHRCAVLADSSARDWVDLVQASMREGARSVLLKAADAVSPPSKEELDRLGLREAMLFAKPIRDVGERYMQEVLQSKPFLAVHCRRTDFLRAREATTPSLEALAEQVELALADFGLQQVYIATDAPDDLREVLRSQVRTGRIFFLEDLDLGADARLEGELAAIEMWIAARATAFLGTQESRFTMHIQIDRSWLGKSFETSNRELCKSLASRRCLSPYYKSTGRRGSQHKDYWELPGSAASSA